MQLQNGLPIENKILRENPTPLRRAALIYKTNKAAT